MLQSGPPSRGVLSMDTFSVGDGPVRRSSASASLLLGNGGGGASPPPAGGRQRSVGSLLHASSVGRAPRRPSAARSLLLPRSPSSQNAILSATMPAARHAASGVHEARPSSLGSLMDNAGPYLWHAAGLAAAERRQALSIPKAEVGEGRPRSDARKKEREKVLP